MAWNDLDDVEVQLARALRQFDWDASDGICKTIVDRLLSEESPFPEKPAKRLLQALRRKRQFATMGLLAEAFLGSGLKGAEIRRQYSQALIDQGKLTDAEAQLQQLIAEPGTNSFEQAQAHGLLGRVYKQRYVNEAGKANRQRAQRNLQRSLDEYACSYSADPKLNTWHGINMVALLARAETDQVAVTSDFAYPALAKTILDTLDRKKEEDATGEISAFDIATQMEAYVALGDCAQATQAANRYIVADGADDFEISGTLRQLLEVWQLKNDKPCGYTLLPILRAAKLEREGVGLTVTVKEARQDLEKLQTYPQGLEKKFGQAGSVALCWYKEGLLRASAVCRIDNGDYKGVGTGWLVSSKDFFPGRPLRAMVLTNTHVVSETCPNALRPPHVWFHFTLLNKRIQMKSIAWSSGETSQFDCTFIELSEELKCDPLSLYESPVEMTEPAPRMYIIGHPGGRDLEFSLNDNCLLACSGEKLHYRTPTEEGSSGSPIFDPRGWKVVGLHHRGLERMPKLNGPAGEFYQANEGISILAIQEKTRSLPLP